MSADEYLTVNEVAARLKVHPKTVRNKMAMGIFKLGVHYFRPKGLSARFKWSAVVAWLEGKDEPQENPRGMRIPMARGYFLGEPLTELDRRGTRFRFK